MAYYLGIDGGGTNSRMVAVDSAGKQIGRYLGETTNLASNPVEVVEKNVALLLDEFQRESKLQLQDCAGFCIGSAGLDTPEYLNEMELLLRRAGLACPLKIINDGELILWAELENKAGIGLISGTGSVAFGKNTIGEVHRVGGWGHLFDDYGSAYWIAREGLSKAFLSYDKRERKSLLEESFIEHFNVNKLDEILPLVYSERENKVFMAGLAILVVNTAKKGDMTALDILQKAGDHLFLAIQTLAQNLNMEKEEIVIASSGGNIENNSLLRGHLTKRISQCYPKAVFKIADQEPVYGAAYLARQLDI